MLSRIRLSTPRSYGEQQDSATACANKLGKKNIFLHFLLDHIQIQLFAEPFKKKKKKNLICIKISQKLRDMHFGKYYLRINA